MAAMDNGLVRLVRTYRDIDAWAARIHHTISLFPTIWREIRKADGLLDLANANAAAGDVDIWELISWNREAAVAFRAHLYDQLLHTNQQLRELRDTPRRKTRLQEYLEACHSIDLAMPSRDILPTGSEVMEHEVIERTLFPQHLVPAADFAADQMRIWRKLAWRFNLRDRACYSSLLGLEWTRKQVDGNIVGCPASLFGFMRMAVDDAVIAIMDQIAKEGDLVRNLEIGPFVYRVEGVHEAYLSRSPLVRGMSTIFAYRIARGVLLETLPVLTTCYRPPSRLSLNEILRGLREEIEPMRDIIWSPFTARFDDMSKVLVVAVITQLYHQMLTVGTRFGYITTGEAYIFLEVSAEDPRFVSYAVCVPRYDVESDPETGLHRTAVAQVLAFTLRALRACRAERMPPPWYHEAQQNLWRWRVNADDIFNKIPPLVRKAKRDIAYEPGIWRLRFPWSVLRRRDRRLLLPRFKPRDEADFNDFGFFKFFTTHLLDPTGLRLDQQPFCTPRCLDGIKHGKALDKDCPNFRHHGDSHLSLQFFVDSLREQLDNDVANENGANYECLRRCGPYTVLFKVRLASRGYTLLLKGVKPTKVDHLRREVDMYGHMEGIQGDRVPLCFGMIQTQRQVNCAFGNFTDFMVFGGFAEGIKPLFQCTAEGVDKQLVVDAVDEVFGHLHRKRVLHFDPEPRNMLYDEKANRVIIADFERAVHDELEGQQWLYALERNEGGS